MQWTDLHKTTHTTKTTHAQATREELCIAFQFQSGYTIGSRSEPLVEQAAAFRTACIRTFQKADIKLRNKKATYQTAFAPKENICSTRCLIGAPYPGIQRRPIWDNTVIEHIVKVTTQAHEHRCEAVAAAKGPYNDDFVIKYDNCDSRPKWKPNPLTEIYNLIQLKKQQLNNQRPSTGTSVPAPVPEESHPNHNNPTATTTTHQRSSPQPKTTRRQGPCHFGHTTTSARANAKDVWLANPAPSFWRGVPTGVSLCQRCYGLGHRARMRGKVAQLPGPSSGPPLQLHLNDAEPAPPSANHLPSAPVLDDPAPTNQPTERRTNAVHEEEFPQSSKRRRTRREVEDAERRRLEKSLPLFHLPADVATSSNSTQSAPSKRLRIDAGPLLHIPSSACKSSHSFISAHSISPSAHSKPTFSNSYSNFCTEPEPISRAIHCQKRHSLVVGSEPVAVVQSNFEPSVEGNSSTFGRRPPEER